MSNDQSAISGSQQHETQLVKRGRAFETLAVARGASLELERVHECAS